MATLTELITSRMTPEVLQKLDGLVGLSTTDTTRAIDTLILTQVGDLVSMGATEAGAHRLLSVLKEHQGTESFAHVLLGGEALQSQAKAGGVLQTAVYGLDRSRRIGSVASTIGLTTTHVSGVGEMVVLPSRPVLRRKRRGPMLTDLELIVLLPLDRATRALVWRYVAWRYATHTCIPATECQVAPGWCVLVGWQ